MIPLLVLACSLAALPAAADAAPMYWGATAKGEVFGMNGEAPSTPAVMTRFEEDAGKDATFVNTAGSWLNFEAAPLESAIAQGQIPLLTLPLGNESSLAKVIDGSEDAKIRAWARGAREFGYPFLLRPWWEVNGTWYKWGQSPEYVTAWRHFHDLVVAEGATNVTWAWVVNTIWEGSVPDPSPWYPGAEYVDWVGMDAYNWGKNPVQPGVWTSAAESIQPTLSILHQLAPEKPVCICESASTEYGSGGSREHKSIWIHEMLDEYLPSHPEIKAYLWFNWNIEDKGQRYDWPIESSPSALQAFKEGIANPTYISQLPPLTKLAKVPIPSPLLASAATVRANPSYEPSKSTPRNPSVSARLRFGPPHLDRRHGTARISVSIPGPGTLELSGKGIRLRVLPKAKWSRTPVTRQVTQARRLTLVIGAAGHKRHSLHRHGKVHVSLSGLFRLVGGEGHQWRTGITLRHR